MDVLVQEVDGVRRVWNRADDRSNGRFERECDVRRLHVLDLLDTESGRFAEEGEGVLAEFATANVRALRVHSADVFVEDGEEREEVVLALRDVEDDGRVAAQEVRVMALTDVVRKSPDINAEDERVGNV